MADLTPDTGSNLLHDLALWKDLKAKAAYRLEEEGFAYITQHEHHNLLHALIARDKHIVTGGFWFFGLSRIAILKNFLDQQEIRIGKFAPLSPSNKPGNFADSIRRWDRKYPQKFTLGQMTFKSSGSAWLGE
jgi:hypothetical protein